MGASLGTVSYTHLDVYKRQPPGRVNQLGADIPRIPKEIAGRKLTAALDSAANYDFVRAGLLPGGRKTEPPSCPANATRSAMSLNGRRRRRHYNCCLLYTSRCV